MKIWKKGLNLFLASLLLFTSINFGAIISFSEQAYSESEITRKHSEHLDIPDKVFRALILRDILDKFEEYDDDHYVLSEDLVEIETAEELTVPEFLLDVDIDESVSYIENLNGIEYFKSLNTLTIEDIDIDSLDLSKNANLKTLNIEGTNLENLDLSKNTNLENLKIENTKLKNLDLSNTYKLKSFDGYSIFTVKSDVVKDKYRLYLDSILTEAEIEDYKKFSFKTINSKNESMPTNIKKTIKGDKLYAELDIKNKDRLEFIKDTGNPNFPLTIRVIPIKSSETIFEDKEGPKDKKIAKEISFHQYPNKKDYIAGEKIDKKGLIAKIQYDDESEEFISLDKFDEYGINLNLIRNNKLISIDSPLEADDKSIQLSINIKEDQKLIAISECLNVSQTYNIRFNITDKGTVKKSDKKYLESKIGEGNTIKNIPAIIPNSGYEFKGWITNNSSTLLTNDEIKTLSVNDDLEITAVYSSISGKLLTEFKDEEFRNRLTQEMKKKGRAPIPDIKLPEGYKYPIYTTDLPVLGSLNKLSISGPYSQWSNDKPVHSIEGIELLKSLEEISLTRNKLEELDLSKNTNLKKIHARENSIKTLKLPKSADSKLEELDISNNEIEELDLKDQKFLHWIEATSNKLNHVDTRGLMRVDRANFYNNELSELDFIDMRTLTELTIGKNNFKKIDIRPAINLKKLIIDGNGLVDLIASGHNNISIIHAENNKIRELKLDGVDSLGQLYLDNNPLELYDANQNPQLTNLGLKNTSLSELDLSKSKNLRSIDISNANDSGNNRIKELDFSNCPKLYKAELNNNYLSKLDFSNNPKLMYLYAKNNMLKEIKLSDNGLSEVDLSNNNLIKIESKLKNLASSKVTLTPQSKTVRAKKVDGRYSINLKELLGESYNWLTNYYKGGELNKETGELKIFEYRDSFEYTIGCGGKGEFPMTVKLIFTDDDIIESMAYVKPFDTEYALDGKVINLPKDTEVIMNTGEFKRLPIEWEEDSVKVDKNNSPITVSGNISGSNYPVRYEIKVISLPKLPDINVSQYESVNLPKNIKIQDLGNADILWEEENINTNDIGAQVINGKIDGIGEITQKIIVKEFKEGHDAFLLNIPNEVLRREISQKISFGRYPIPNNVKVPRNYKYPLYSTDLPKIKKIVSLDIKGTNPNTVNFRENPKLTSLKGIELLENLSSLTIKESDIETIDLSNNKNLNTVVSKYNNTENLILGELPKLETLLIGGNKIKDLDLSGAKALTRVEAPSCNIENININNLDKLTRLWINNNNIVSIDTSTNTKLEEFNISDNKLSGSLDATKNLSLKYLRAFNNNITELKANDLPELRSITINNNIIEKINIASTPYLYSLIAFDNAIEDIEIKTSEKMNELDLRNNKLKSLDISTLSNLDRLKLSNEPEYVNKNIINSLDFSKNIKLGEVYLDGIGISTLDFSKNAELRILSANDNKIEKLNLFENSNLKNIYLDNNDLNEFILPKLTSDWWGENSVLGELSLYNNKLENLDLKKHTRLRALICGNNNLVALDLSDNSILGDSNPLSIEPQTRTITAKKLNDEIIVDLNEIMDSNSIKEIKNLKGGELDTQTGYIKIEPGKKSILYDYSTGNRFENTMEVNLIVDGNPAKFDKNNVVKMKVVKNPNKTEYVEDEIFESEGLVLELTDKNNVKTEIIPSDFEDYEITIDKSKLKKGDDKITISKKGLDSIEIDIKVNEKIIYPDDDDKPKNDTDDSTGANTGDNGSGISSNIRNITEENGSSPAGNIDNNANDSNNNKNNDKDAIKPSNKRNPYIEGYEDKSFKPEKTISRAEASKIIAYAIKNFDNNKNYRNSFKDIPKDSWYENVIGFMESENAIEGYEDSYFKPDGEITRAEFCAIVSRLNGYKELQIQTKFNDINDHWAKSYILFAENNNWIEGYGNGIFNPDGKIKRAEAVKIINNILNLKIDKAFIDKNISRYTTFTDITKDHWAYYEIIKAANLDK